jgi:hypothetical protein
MLKNDERFSNISSGIQNIILGAAVIIGGAWTAFIFSTLRTKYKAEAEITELELRNARSKEELAEKGAVVDIKLDAKQEILADDKRYCIAVVAKITNTGIKNTLVDFSQESPLTAYLILFHEDGTSERMAVVTQEEYNSSSTVVRSGYTTQLPLFIKVKSKGLYVLEFRIRLDKNELLIDNAKRDKNSENIYWEGSTYVLIK